MKKDNKGSLLIITVVILLLMTTVIVIADDAKKSSAQITETVVTNQTEIDHLKSQLEKYNGITSGMSSVLAGEMINWFVLSGGGTNAASTSYKILGTIGQTAVRKSSSTNYLVNHGYWQNLTSSGCCDNPGDANNDGTVGISDLTYFVDYMFSGGPAPICYDEFDNNADCTLGISDLTFFVDYMFNGGPDPVCGCAS